MVAREVPPMSDELAKLTDEEVLSELLGIRPKGRSMVRRTPEGCVLWLGQKGHDGYAYVMVGQARVALHRLVYEIAHRALRPGEVVRHAVQCGHRHCIAPAHLSAGTQAQNMEDMKIRRRAGLPSTVPAHVKEYRRRRRAAIASSVPSE